METVRVLVVDDFEPFRRLVRSLLANSRLTIIGEASDGLEAVRKATLLEPDLILLDLVLPKLNGLRAAEQIRKIIPQSKILCLAQDNSPDVLQAALDAGALGYLHKSRIDGHLLLAVEYVLAGKQFTGVGPKLPIPGAE